MTTRIHINQHHIKSNRKRGTDKPVITVKSGRNNTYSNEAVIYGQDGLEAARVVYSPCVPLSCGAHVWIETSNGVKSIDGITFKEIKSTSSKG